MRLCTTIEATCVNLACPTCAGLWRIGTDIVGRMSWVNGMIALMVEPFCICDNLITSGPSEDEEGAWEICTEGPLTKVIQASGLIDPAKISYYMERESVLW